MAWYLTSGQQGYKGLVDTGAQCILIPPSYRESENICISGMTGMFQQLIVFGGQSDPQWEWVAKAPHCGWSRDSMHPWQRLRRGCFKDPKGWAFCIAVLQMEEIGQVSSLPSLSEDLCVVWLLKVEEQQGSQLLPQQCTNGNISPNMPPIHKLICWLESQGVISKTAHLLTILHGQWKGLMENGD